MNELSTWMQSNWYELGNLLAQFTFLIAGVWFARRILKTIRASQEQFGALLKLSLSDAVSDRARTNLAMHEATSSALAEPSSQYILAEWPKLSEAPALTLPGDQHKSRRFVAAWRGVTRWLQTPMRSNGPAPWRRVVRWLQAPARS